MVGTSLDCVVLDTNNIVSFFFSEEYDFFVSLKWRHKIQLLTCRQQMDELTEALNYPKVGKQLKAKPKELIRFFKEYSTTIEVDERFNRIADLKDNYLVDLAFTGKADYLVSGDREVLKLKHIGKI